MTPRRLFVSATLLAPLWLLPSAERRAPTPALAPSGMVKIPAGTFDYGTDTSEVAAIVAKYHLPNADLINSETPKYTVKMPAFWLDKHEVTVNAYILSIVRDTMWLPKGDSGKVSNGDYLKLWQGGTAPQATDTLPVTYVTWFAARRFCQKEGKRLPTELEWEYAARGGAVGDVYPWGSADADTSRANYGASLIDHTRNVGQYAANPFGLSDMAGNVWEFTADQWTDPRMPPGKKAVEVEVWSKDRDQAARQRVAIKGGSYTSSAVSLRVRGRYSHPAGGAEPNVGFRCAKDA